MFGQYLSNTNESATVSIFQNFLELNQAWIGWKLKWKILNQDALEPLLLFSFAFRSIQSTTECVLLEHIGGKDIGAVQMYHKCIYYL